MDPVFSLSVPHQGNALTWLGIAVVSVIGVTVGYHAFFNPGSSQLHIAGGRPNAVASPLRAPIQTPHHSHQSAVYAVPEGDLVSRAKQWLYSRLAGDYDVKAIQEEMLRFESSSSLAMYSFTTCPFCIKAKNILDSAGAKYKVLELNTLPQGKAIQAELAKRTGRTSVPSIWIKGEYVGGCNDGGLGGVATLQSQGRLVPLLREAGALAK